MDKIIDELFGKEIDFNVKKRLAGYSISYFSGKSQPQMDLRYMIRETQPVLVSRDKKTAIDRPQVTFAAGISPTSPQFPAAGYSPEVKQGTVTFFADVEQFANEYAVMTHLKKQVGSPGACKDAATCAEFAYIFGADSVWIQENVIPKLQVENRSAFRGKLVFATAALFAAGADVRTLLDGWRPLKTRLLLLLETERDQQAKLALKMKHAALNLCIDMCRDIAKLHDATVAHRGLRPDVMYARKVSPLDFLILSDDRLDNFFVNFGDACIGTPSNETLARILGFVTAMNDVVGPRTLNAASIASSVIFKGGGIYYDPLVTESVWSKAKEEGPLFSLAKKVDIFSAAVIIYELMMEQSYFSFVDKKTLESIPLRRNWVPPFGTLADDAAGTVKGNLVLTFRNLHKAVGDIGLEMVGPLKKREEMNYYVKKLEAVREQFFSKPKPYSQYSHRVSTRGASEGIF